MLREIVVGIFAIFLSALFLLRQKRPKNFPPGPRGIPLFGNAFQLSLKPYKGAIKMAKDYGDILGLTVGSQRVVILSDPDDIRETNNKIEYVGKNIYNAHTDQNPGVSKGGLVYYHGKIYTDHRRFCLKTLREFGVGRRSLESIMMIEVEDLIERFRKISGKPISTSQLFNAPIFNIIWHVVAAERLDHDDPTLVKMIHLLHVFMINLLGVRAFFFLFPWLVELKNKFPFLFRQDHKRMVDELWKFFDNRIMEHRKTIDVDNPRDLIDCFLLEAQKTENDPTTSFSNSDNDEGLKLLLLDLFLAGTETSSTMMCWLCYLLALHPHVQLKLYNEICSVTKSRTVCLNDRSSLPFAEAVIAETSRLASLVPLNLRSTTEDVTLKGFSIPKNTLISPNVYAVHHSEEIWKDPENFRPERFLSDDGKTYVKNPNLMPFSMGKRSCIGELLARDEIFLFLTNLILNFKFTLPSDEPAHSIEGIYCVIAIPEPHRIIITDRNK